MVQLADRCACRRLDTAEDVLRARRILIDHHSCRARLHAHDRHVVSDDVVQLTGDAHPLQGDGLRRVHLALVFEVGGAPFESLALHGGLPGVLAEEVRAREVQHVDEQVQQHVGEVRRHRARDDVLLAGGVDGIAIHREQQPDEHAGDDRGTHHERRATVGHPGADGIERDEHRDVAGIDLGDAEGDADEIRDGHDDEDRRRPDAAECQRCGHDREVDQRLPERCLFVAVDLRDRRQRGADDSGEEHDDGQQRVGLTLTRRERARGCGHDSTVRGSGCRGIRPATDSGRVGGRFDSSLRSSLNAFRLAPLAQRPASGSRRALSGGRNPGVERSRRRRRRRNGLSERSESKPSQQRVEALTPAAHAKIIGISPSSSAAPKSRSTTTGT